jgi:radical SAM protein with 4Fe4S-binding SPASM domain
VIEEAKRIGVQRVYLSGGEPLLRRDIFMIIAHLTNLGIKTQIITNATLITPEVAKKLFLLGIRTLNVSFDGSDEKMFEQNRGRGTFERVKSGVKACSDAGLEVAIDFILSSKNLHQIPSIYELATKLKCKRVNLRRFIPIGRGKEMKDLLLSPSQMHEALHIWDKTSEKYRSLIVSTIHEPLYLVYLSQVRKLNKINPAKVGCKASSFDNSWLCIKADGTITPCPLLISIPIGNIRETSLKEAFDSQSCMTLKNIEKFVRGKCKTCKWLNICRGGCKATTFALFGSFYLPDPCCWI